MSHSITGRARAIALTVAALVSVPVLAGTSVAAPIDMYAPYARAAAKVAANGTLLAQKNIDEAGTRKVATGQYCVKVSDPDIDDLKDAAVHVTSNSNWATFIVVATPVTVCGSDPNTIYVRSINTADTWADTAFTLTVQ
ncbi:hypothetical protein OG264_38570 (plasmid) [Streptomyces xanthophaeus]|uniref:hypothetical protein n=1 Tax=Streptomyces TaxID=1883 RepID=UPI002E136BF4|nr:hypothetical protein OG730_08690 [Streptomyces sp. NBC_01298]WST27473.1 hypothetical protein OG264_38570 [Streptomyces xanthophaeus]WST65804.1 hypothetical protein OG605_40215 [Streptomyces xanthophaeus]